jgi:methionine-rich copper-binding protein CopC
MRLPRAARAALLSLVGLALLPAAALGHSELISSSPSDGDVRSVAPVEITGLFTEPVDPDRSSMELRGPDGGRLARGGVPDGGPRTRMTIPGLPPLAPGRYEVRWTTVTPDDDGVERGRFTFTVAEPTPAPPTATPTVAPTATPVAATATPPVATVAPTPGPSLGSSPRPDPDPEPATAVADVLIPLGVLALVLGGGAAWLLRRRR